MLMQMWTVKLSPTDFGYFSSNLLNNRTEKCLFLTENKSRWSRWFRTRRLARAQLHACVKCDLVDRDFFHISNFVRQYLRFWSVNFFQIFGGN